MRYSVTFLLAVASAAPAWGQTITGVSPSAAERSARVVVKGSGFGFVQGDAELLVDGVAAVVTHWSDTKIRAHLAHATPLGPAEVRVVRGGQSSGAAALEVLAPSGRDGRILWRTQLDHYYSLSRPAVGPEGDVYVTGIGGPLYALSPAGAVQWAKPTATGARPAAVAPDGTVYLAGGPGTISALTPDGETIWSYNTPSNAGEVFVGPNVGPDGKIYAVTTEEPTLGTDFGAFALEPDGSLAWSTSGGYNQRRLAYGWEVAFSHGRAVFATGQGDPPNGNHGVHALDMAGGAEEWLRVGRGNLQADDAGNLYWLGAINNNFIGSYGADGVERWRLEYNQFTGQPGSYIVAPTGVSYYCTSTFSTLAAIEADGSVRWQERDFNHLLSLHGVSPDGERFFGVARPTDNSAPKLRLWAGADGGVLWERDVARENDVWMVPQWEGAVSRDGRTIYITISGNNYIEDPYSYLYAVDITEGGRCPGDFDGDGTVNTLDVLAFLNAWSAGGPSGDFNLDGVVNTLDVLGFLNAWSAGC